jgi:hypothetical protein
MVEKWLLCPACGSKTRVKLRQDTELKNFPLFCPKCKREVLVSVSQFITTRILEPDAKTQMPMIPKGDMALHLRFRGKTAL